MNLHPWIWIALLFVQLLAGTFAASVCISGRRHFLFTAIVSAIAAALPAAILQSAFAYKGADSDEYWWFYLAPVPFLIIAMLPVVSAWVLVLFFWFATLILLGCFMTSGGVFMLFSPLILALGLIIYVWHKNLVATAGPFKALVYKLGGHE